MFIAVLSEQEQAELEAERAVDALYRTVMSRHQAVPRHLSALRRIRELEEKAEAPDVCP